jgi:hypothetical protein
LPGESAKRVFALDDPAIHLLRKALVKMMDTRVKPAYDERICRTVTDNLTQINTPRATVCTNRQNQLEGAR